MSAELTAEQVARVARYKSLTNAQRENVLYLLSVSDGRRVDWALDAVQSPGERAAAGVHPIGMSLHFEDADPVATCLVGECRWHGHGDAMVDAANAWVAHIASEHRSDWGDDQ